MNGLMEYWNLAVAGFGGFVAEYKYLALIICVMLYALMHWRQYQSGELKKFLLYSGVVILLLLIPVTGLVFLIYQTRFYEYGWIWSCVPLTAILAWGIVTVVYEEIPATGKRKEQSTGRAADEKKSKWARYCGMLAAVAVLFMCGNQGRVQQVSDETIQMRQAGGKILQYLEEENLLQDHVLWGPAEIMQYLRTHNGEVRLFYGRDMWDAKAGAYDYEAYLPEETACYQWMETVSSAHNLYLLEVQQAPDAVHEALAAEGYIREAVSREVDVIIVPAQITGWMKRKMELIAAEEGLSVAAVQVGEYTVWMFG